MVKKEDKKESPLPLLSIVKRVRGRGQGFTLFTLFTIPLTPSSYE